MRKIVLLMYIACLPFLGDAQSMMEMQLSEEEKYNLADKELNRVYQLVLKEYAENSQFIENLRKSQRIWITFRDAELLTRYPENAPVREGTIFNTCYVSHMTELTERRTKDLKLWLTGVQQGDGCGGSVKTIP